MPENVVNESVISLEKAKEQDVPALKVELVRSFGKFCVGKFGLDGVDLIPPAYLLDESFKRSDQTLYIIKADEKKIGATLLTDMGNGAIIVDIFFLSEDHSGVSGTKVWEAIERSQPQARLWKLLTPYSERRNINFYINKCGFKITEYFNEYHYGKIMDEYGAVECDYGGFFLFEKEIKNISQFE